MKVAIIVFSPTGNTLKVAKIMEEKMLNREFTVQLIDITRKNIFKDVDGMEKYVLEAVTEHDLLCIGGPVYSHHMHYNVLNIIKALPTPRNSWGNLAVPFVTFGSISSGVALHEAGMALKGSGRKNVCGLKANSFHCMSRLLDTKVNEGMPGKEIEPIIEELIDRLSKIDLNNTDQYKDVLSDLNYQHPKGKLMAKTIFREAFFQNHIYPVLILDKSKCVKCGKCVESCPVQRLKFSNGSLDIKEKNPSCVHCTECINACRYNAINFKFAKEKWNNLFKNASEGKGPLPSNEYPKSGIYPEK